VTEGTHGLRLSVSGAVEAPVVWSHRSLYTPRLTVVFQRGATANLRISDD